MKHFIEQIDSEKMTDLKKGLKFPGNGTVTKELEEKTDNKLLHKLENNKLRFDNKKEVSIDKKLNKVKDIPFHGRHCDAECRQSKTPVGQLGHG